MNPWEEDVGPASAGVVSPGQRPRDDEALGGAAAGLGPSAHTVGEQSDAVGDASNIQHENIRVRNSFQLQLPSDFVAMSIHTTPVMSPAKAIH